MLHSLSDSARDHRIAFRNFICTVLSIAVLSGFGVSQVPPQHSRGGATTTHAPASNAQLASPDIERRVNALLKQMTLEEKIGQLMQYNDVGYAAATTAEAASPAIGANPETHNRVDAMQLASTGRLGSMLNTVGAAKTNAFQHAAVDKSRLHIPLLFGADVIHGYRTIYPVPLGLAAMWDPDMIASVAHMSSEEATTAQ